MRYPKIGGIFLGVVPQMMTIAFWCLYLGPPFQGKHHTGACGTEYPKSERFSVSEALILGYWSLRALHLDYNSFIGVRDFEKDVPEGTKEVGTDL